MISNNIPEPLAHFLETYCDVNAVMLDELKTYVKNTLSSERTQEFRRQLAYAIINNSITTEQYEKLTGEDFDTQEDLNAWLKEIWENIFGTAPVSP